MVSVTLFHKKCIFINRSTESIIIKKLVSILFNLQIKKNTRITWKTVNPASKKGTFRQLLRQCNYEINWDGWQLTHSSQSWCSEYTVFCAIIYVRKGNLWRPGGTVKPSQEEDHNSTALTNMKTPFRLVSASSDFFNSDKSWPWAVFFIFFFFFFFAVWMNWKSYADGEFFMKLQT